MFLYSSIAEREVYEETPINEKNNTSYGFVKTIKQRKGSRSIILVVTVTMAKKHA